MIHKNIIIGSGFSSLGAVFSLNYSKEKFVIIGGKAKTLDKDVNLIDLPSRNFNKYKSNIFQSIQKNNLIVNRKNNFISFLGFGGLSNLWGKIFNYDIKGNYNIKRQLINYLNLKEHKKINLHKDIYFYKVNEQKINLKKIFHNFNKKKNSIINSTVDKIKYDKELNIFHVYLDNAKILKAKNIYLASGIFSTLKLLRSIDKKIFKKKIELNHSDMCYGIFFVKNSNFKNNIGNEFLYFSKDKKEFSGRISILEKKIIKKYNLNFLFNLLMIISKFLGYKIFLLSVLYKRSKNSSVINFKRDLIKINARKTFKNKFILNKLKKIFNECFNANKFIFKTTLVGSDFHYTGNIANNINLKKVKKFYKNLFLLDSSYSTSHIYFPTFQMIYDSYSRIKYNISLKKMIKK